MILNILILCFSITYIINHSGVVFDLSRFVWQLTHKGKEWNYQMIKKPFGCAVCMSFWVTLVFLLFNSVGLVYALGSASLMGLFSIVVDKLIGLFVNLINKI
jgi:hypothetical protein